MTFKGGKIKDRNHTEPREFITAHHPHAVISMHYIPLYIPIHSFTVKVVLLPTACSFVLSLKIYIIKIYYISCKSMLLL